MAKLYFRYGAMNSGKSTALMQVAYNYEERGMRVLIMKPSIDTKGGEKLMSRLGVERRVDIAVRPDMDPLALVRADIAKNGPLACVLTDESQCGRKAMFNGRKVNGKFVFEGAQVAIDMENNVQYESLCPQCYFRERDKFFAEKAAEAAQEPGADAP